MTSSDLHALTAPLRARMRRARRAIPAAERERFGLALAARVRATEAWQRARVVALYVALPTEAPTAALLAFARADGKRVGLPRVVAPACPLEFHAPWDSEPPLPLVRGAFGVLEPPTQAPRIPYDALDLILLPGLAVDPHGRRLGQGGGYYDRTLPLAPRATRLLIHFECQVVDAIPTGPDDIDVHLAVSESRLRAFRGDAPYAG